MKEKLLNLLNNSHSPYSNFKVAAIVVMNDGQIFKGVNVEMPTYSGSICAERNAINSAVAHSYKKGDFKELHIMVASEQLAFPCFICRQSIVEFFNLNSKLFLLSKTKIKEYKMSDIIVNPFSAENLK